VQPLIRNATIADLSALLTLEQSIIDAERPFDSQIREGDTTYYDFDALISNPDSSVVVADTGNKIIGSGYAQIRESKECFTVESHCYLGFIFVVPEYRGTGVARRIIESLTEWGSSMGTDYFLLDVYSANTGAIRAYEKFGFKKLSVKMELVR